MARQVSILGATGSIGRSTVDLLARAPQDFTIEALTANRDVAGMAATARRLRAKLAVNGDEVFYQPLKEALAGSGVEDAAGHGAREATASRPVDWTMTAIVGSAGLKPTTACTPKRVVSGTRVS